MHYGSGQTIRQAIMVAKPWQRYLLGVAMITVGAVLVAIGHIAGGLLAVAGVVLLWRMVRHRLRPEGHDAGTGGQRSAGLNFVLVTDLGRFHRPGRDLWNSP